MLPPSENPSPHPRPAQLLPETLGTTVLLTSIPFSTAIIDDLKFLLLAWLWHEMASVQITTINNRGQLPPLVPSLVPNCFLPDPNPSHRLEREGRRRKKSERSLQVTHLPRSVFQALEAKLTLAVEASHRSVTSKLSPSIPDASQAAAAHGFDTLDLFSKPQLKHRVSPAENDRASHPAVEDEASTDITLEEPFDTRDSSKDLFALFPEPQSTTSPQTPTSSLTATEIPFIPLEASEYSSPYSAYAGQELLDFRGSRKRSKDEGDDEDRGEREGSERETSRGTGSGGDGDGQGERPKKRIGKKTELACHFCRGRKLKCDGARPTCYNCARRSLACAYDENVRRRGPGKKTRLQQQQAAPFPPRQDSVPSTSPPVPSSSTPSSMLYRQASYPSMIPSPVPLPSPPMPQYPYQPPRVSNPMIGPGVGLQGQAREEERSPAHYPHHIEGRSHLYSVLSTSQLPPLHQYKRSPEQHHYSPPSQPQPQYTHHPQYPRNSHPASTPMQREYHPEHSGPSRADRPFRYYPPLPGEASSEEGYDEGRPNEFHARRRTPPPPPEDPHHRHERFE